MPTILRWKGHRFHFFSNEGNEPPHIHVRHAEDTCKFWLDPVALAYNEGLSPTELGQIEDVVQQHRDQFLEAWQ